MQHVLDSGPYHTPNHTMHISKFKGECWHGHAYVHVHNSLLVTAFSVWSTNTTLALRPVINDGQIYTSPHTLMSLH